MSCFSMSRIFSLKRFKKCVAYSVIVSMLATTATPAIAGFTDLSDVPLTTSSTTVVKPNILFTLDDSGSMAWGHMPDSYENNTGYVGYKYHLCNPIYYNPNTRYAPPKNSNGTDFANASFTAAKYNGFYAGFYGPVTISAAQITLQSSTVDLSASFRAFDNDTGRGNGDDIVQPAYYYSFTGVGTPTSTQCEQISSSAFPHSSTNFIKVRVSATSGPGATDERQNFANWYSFYRTRMLMMKSSTGRAFAGVTDSYRVGFITINPGNPVTANKYLAINDFTVAQRTTWYAKLYSQPPSSSTPLREALSRAGRHFAGKQDQINSGMTGDPMQYSCQQNFTFLTTDGYWNGPGGVQLDGTTAIGNHDGVINATAPRPIFDGSVSSTTVVTNVDTEAYSTSGCSGSRKKIVRSRNTTTVVTNDTTGASTTSTSSSSLTVVSCTITPRALQTPNPQTTTSTSTATSGGSSGSLADVAQYYYITDLRPNGSIGALGTDVGTGLVPSGGSGAEGDTATHQHMTTFTMGLGLSGTLNFQPNYKTGAGDFAAIRSGSLNWPTAVPNDPTALDDLWHAAVNGRGQFFSAANPDAVVDGLQAALAGVNARTSSSASAATSNLEPVSGDNFAYTASYTTVQWTGDIKAREISLTTGAVSATPIWSAQAKLDVLTNRFCDNRAIKLFRSGATNNLTNFTWNTSACDGSGNPTGAASTGLNAAEQAQFDSSKVALLSHYPSMTDGTSGTVNQRTLAAGANMLNFLRGHRGYENFLPNDANALYRTRTNLLGDVINAQPTFVKGPSFNYSDAGYSAYKAANASRTSMLYVAANDGMLHALRAGTPLTQGGPPDPLGGEERWAFIPTMVMPNLYKLADDNYGNSHQFFVDGTPTTGDVYDPAGVGAWKSILVAGLNKGGKGYYALDISDPANPKGLWEFKHNASVCTGAGATSDCHLGYSYGTPIISKLADGRWAVFVTSGYNNVNSPAITGDGVGYLYVLDAITGAIIHKISTGYGDATTPSGLSQITNRLANPDVDNTTLWSYGTDLEGNVWRFDVGSTPAATLLGVARDTSGTRQPIMVKPRIAGVGTPAVPYIYVATGRYLGSSDLGFNQQQSLYAFKESSAPFPNLQTSTLLKQMTITNAGAVRNIACTGNCTATDGWRANLPDTGERVNVSFKIELGTVVVASNVPTSTPCTPGGYSWLNFFDAATGEKITTSNSLGVKFADNPIVGLSLVRLPDGRIIVIVTLGGGSGGGPLGSDPPPVSMEVPVNVGAPAGKRISWRELVQ